MLSDQQKTDESTLKQMEDINQSIIENQPLISEATSISAALRDEYINNTDSPGFLTGIEYLNNKYTKIRRVRGDGNCFYRSLLFSYLENLTMQLSMNSEEAKQEYDRILGIVKNSKDALVAVGYDEFAVDSFYETFVEFLEEVPSLSPELLFRRFVEGGEADYYTWYMRLLTAGQLRRQEERFFPFVDTGVDVDMAGYCRREVEPMGRESEQLHIIALTECLGLRVAIEYLDGREFDAATGLSCICFPQMESDSSDSTGSTAAELCYFSVHLLYRPGHYDILYR